MRNFNYLCNPMENLLPLNLPHSPLLEHCTLIAGPCSAESEAIMASCAMAMKEAGIGGALRAGAWKPRTRPGCFEGYGKQALEWIKNAAIKAFMPAGTEVATAENVKDAVEAGMDFLWIGARTSASPFAMQQLADAIAEYAPEIAVLVKNPLNPDLELWIGALQRLYNAGVRRLGAIHRGFSVYDSAPYRNAPLWQIPLELHRRYPSLPLLHDPSHTGGARHLIAPLCQAALDLGFDGLMIECHPSPENAMSDGGQQLTPRALAQLLASLKVRKGTAPEGEIRNLRLQIDEIDSELLSLLSRRMKLTDEIGHLKRSADMPVLQPIRYNRLLTLLIERGEKLGLSKPFLQKLLETIHEESVRRQLEIVNSQL